MVAVAGHESDPSLAVPVLALRVVHSQLRKDPAGARAAVDQLASLLPADHRSLFDLACCTSRLAATLRAADMSPEGQQRAQEAAARAVNLLKQAIAAGYRNTPYLAQEPAFDGIRDDEAFKAILAELPPAVSPGGE